MDHHPSGSYAPRSPDLSALMQPTHPSDQQDPNFIQDSNPFYPSTTPQRLRESFSLPSSSYQQHLQPPQTNAFGQMAAQPYPPLDNQAEWDPDSAIADQASPAADQPLPKKGRGRKPSSKSAPVEDSEMSSLPNEPTEDYGPAPGDLEGINVRTKFPTARIKRIVQADEDVGKVAQATPVVVSKALELFMISLTLKAAEEARSKGSKRVTAVHLKQAVQNDSQFDFLSEVVGKISDQPTSKDKSAKGVKSEDEDDMDEAMDTAPPPSARSRKSKAAGGAKKKRSKSDDD